MNLFAAEKKMILNWTKEIDKMVKFRIFRISHRSGRSRLPFITAKSLKNRDLRGHGRVGILSDVSCCHNDNYLKEEKFMTTTPRESIISLFLTNYDYARLH